MAGIDNLDDIYATLRRLQADVAKLGAANPLQSSSITTGRLRIGGSAILLVDSSGGLVVHGSINGDGTISWSGAFTLSGLTKLLGTTRFEGDTTQVGPFHIQGATDLTGTLTINGLVSLLQNLTVTAPGKITIAGGSSPATLQNGALSFGTGGVVEADTTNNGLRMIVSGGGRVYVGTGAASLQYGTKSVTVTGTQTTVSGGLATDTLSTSGSKQFAIPHPLKPGVTLRHGSTESPVSGIEYWGDGVILEDGAAVVSLPDYFEALAKPENRAVFVTGRGFVADWSDIDGGRFVVSGEPGRRFSWQVKAERYGADFVTEDATAE